MRFFPRRFTLAISLILMAATNLSAEPIRAYIGTSTPKPGEEGSKGIYTATFDTATGTWSETALAAECASPGFLAVHPNGQWVYAVHAVRRPDGKSEVSAFAIQSDGTLALLNSVETGGHGPCHVSIDPTNGLVFLANYGGQSVASFKIQSDGRLSDSVSVVKREGSSVNERRQKQPAPHSVYPHPTLPLLLNADLGTDEVVAYAYDRASGKLDENPSASAKLAILGGGPRHLAITSDGKRIYSANEMHGTVSAFQFDGKTFTEFQQSKIGPEDATSAAEIRLHPSGKFLYASTRAPTGGIGIFSINDADGKLTPAGFVPSGGNVPRNFEVTSDGRWLLAANSGTSNIAVFAIDPATGALTQKADADLQVPQPMCVRFVENQ